MPGISEVTNGDSSSGNASESIADIVKDNVTCKASFSDYTWTVTIESKVAQSIIGANVDFKIGHGNSYDSECVVIDSADENTSKSVLQRGGSTVITISEPFYYYFIYRRNYGDDEILAECSMYLSSYKSLVRKELSGTTLVADEKSLKNNLIKYLDKYLSQASSHVIYVFAYVDGNSVRIGKFSR